jgi:hypothetical protein
MINFNKFIDLGWQFKMPFTTNNTNKCFDFKSNRMKDFRHYNSILQSDDDNSLLEYEKECYLNQLMFKVNSQLYAVEADIKRQLKIHVNRNLPIPNELGVDIKLKIV